MDLSTRIANLPAEKLQLLLQEIGKKKNGAARAELTRRDRNHDSFPLSFAQQRLWFLDQLDSGNYIYNEPSAVRLEGVLNVAALEHSFNQIIRRHEVLRTRFTTKDGKPVQVIVPSLTLTLPVVDLSELPTEKAAMETERLAIEEARLPFNLSEGPFLRAVLLRTSATAHVLLLTMHHIVSDAWSIGILIRELSAFYQTSTAGKPSSLAPLPIQYADFACWQREWLQGEVLEKHLTYWRKELAGAPSELNLPADRPRGATQTFHGGSYSFDLSPRLTNALRTLSCREEVTLFITLLAAFQTLLSRYTGETDIIVGANIANRSRRETEGLIGFFINMLALRVDLSGDPSFRTLLSRVRTLTLNGYAHQDLPFDKLVEELQPERIAGRSPLFNVVFNYYVPDTPDAIPGLTLTPLAFDYQVGRFDLSLIMIDNANGLSGVWKYRTDLFDDARIKRMHAHFETLLESIVADPEARLSALETLTALERKELMVSNKELRRTNFKKFMGVKPRTISSSQRDLVKTSYLSPGQTLPLVVQPAAEDVDLAAWAKSNAAFINSELLRHGALLFRNFNVDSISDFHTLATAICGELLDYVEPSSPRSELGNKVYTSTEYPADQTIYMHNEMSYSLTWPRKVMFFCQIPATSGGETPLAVSRKVFEHIDPAIRDEFIRKKVMYVRNFGGGFHRPWQEFFKTTDRATIEGYCGKAGIELQWKDTERLRIRQICQAVAEHPVTGEVVWFNQAHAFHFSTLDETVRSVLLAEIAEEDLPRNAYYGDGSPIEPAVIDKILDAYRQATIAFPWQKRDVLLIDNMAVAHGRAPFVGPRAVLVAMAEPYSTHHASVN